MPRTDQRATFAVCCGCVLWLCAVAVCCGCVLWICAVAVCYYWLDHTRTRTRTVPDDVRGAAWHKAREMRPRNGHQNIASKSRIRGLSGFGSTAAAAHTLSAAGPRVRQRSGASRLNWAHHWITSTNQHPKAADKHGGDVDLIHLDKISTMSCRRVSGGMPHAPPPSPYPPPHTHTPHAPSRSEHARASSGSAIATDMLRICYGAS